MNLSFCEPKAWHITPRPLLPALCTPLCFAIDTANLPLKILSSCWA